ncbi:ARF GTPase-activating protein GIT2-like isoform X11 [Myxocyprinus asiaticus]|uniref:ARF GTPase-activating protein GIT2-like isoform X1 n=1 Tax=Myxocyprinus asiaticus TaxID=70543 RepID=UPI0022216366|nr:ARF GTPase-activating protein GIT2-like isoform X1 [Myxocyprinus asiaticus]XP_051539074.1 ARF GTPase-activating protein GIT2-like isoform X2 [Myxocyprinus asiaticus]XP_051539075.1 ARF GTPase-activating protein GIT2-like isoform X3 [Myxocyprinus asiaticus]XP_051539076.1 ARF GTPase-activating protein GIT2-like isoform X4 [Myxocyprinus asiaticus]XP_051539077.1 ARF GTPase-activating protein GIT2-like isoform X5 [Myxocyprinus asiaticus]XP_051539078.1 ARF GTPase-activating protein GIT2-like isofo
MMSIRARNREICADCSAPDARWASINRGILICDECCSIHRGLGRHSSQVRHLTQTLWPPSQLQMVKSLYNNGANSIWEHSLLDPSSIMSGKRKANPQDRVHPNKTDFIKAKYQMLAFVHRMPCREDDSVTAKDLSKQLHSSVRTGNLETCLRLLSLGAQANFFHPEKGNTPLHVAAKAGQLLQAELLTVYGADPGALDSSGNTPIDYARQAGHQDLADRLVEIQFELTDRIAFYLCGRKPDHKNGQHFLIPQVADSSLDLSELAKAAKKKLQSLSNHQFEELAMDVYDEVDRRETDAVWLATQNHSTLVTDTTVVPFLPVNPEYSSTRNQGRQKLARFNAHEFATLVIDILTDAKRRQQGNSPDNFKDNVELILKDISNQHSSESPETDQPDYDSVASDEDTEPEVTSGKDERAKSSESSDLSDSPITVQEFMEVKSALNASEAKIQQLLKVNCHLSEELRLMQSKLNSLQNENSSLKWQTPNSLGRPQDLPHRAPPRGCRAMSMYETGSSLRQYHPRGETVHPDTNLTLQPLPSNIGKGPSVTAFSSLPSFPSSLSWSWNERTQRGCSLDAQRNMPENDYDKTLNHVALEDPGGRGSGWLGDGTVPQSENPSEVECDSNLPCTEDVISKTELITKNIQELLRAAQENNHESFVPCSERILVAVTEMATLFPKRPSSEMVRGSLRLLTSSASRLQGECQKATPHDSQQVIQCAYDIAKAAKQLVTVTTKDSN